VEIHWAITGSRSVVSAPISFLDLRARLRPT
jgi:hypothetical protein